MPLTLYLRREAKGERSVWEEGWQVGRQARSKGERRGEIIAKSGVIRSGDGSKREGGFCFHLALRVV